MPGKKLFGITFRQLSPRRKMHRAKQKSVTDRSAQQERRGDGDKLLESASVIAVSSEGDNQSNAMDAVHSGVSPPNDDIPVITLRRASSSGSTSTSEQLRRAANRESFSSIASFRSRRQFQQALEILQREVFGELPSEEDNDPLETLAKFEALRAIDTASHTMELDETLQKEAEIAESEAKAVNTNVGVDSTGKTPHVQLESPDVGAVKESDGTSSSKETSGISKVPEPIHDETINQGAASTANSSQDELKDYVIINYPQAGKVIEPSSLDLFKYTAGPDAETVEKANRDFDKEFDKLCGGDGYEPVDNNDPTKAPIMDHTNGQPFKTDHLTKAEELGDFKEDDYLSSYLKKSGPTMESSERVHSSSQQTVTVSKSSHDTFVQRFSFETGDTISSGIENLHEQTDSLIQKMRGGDNVEGNVLTQPASTAKSGFGREVSPDERTFEREGPLTIPSERPFDAAEAEEDVKVTSSDVQSPWSPDILPDGESEQRRFEMRPRPPTPPKTLDDEDVKPTTLNFRSTPTHRSDEPPRSILKHDEGSRGWFSLAEIDPRILALIYWRDPKKSGATLAAIIVALLLFASFPVVSLLSYAGLTLLLLTIGFRCFKLGQSMMQKGDSSNPFQEYLNKDLTCSKECAYKKVDQIIEKGTPLVDHARRLFLVENIQDSLKLALLLWAFTYVGSWFSGTCLLIMFVLGVFSIPKFYEVYKEPIDKNLEVVKAKVDEVTKKVHDKVPFLKEASKPASTTVTLAPSEEEHPKTN